AGRWPVGRDESHHESQRPRPYGGPRPRPRRQLLIPRVGACLQATPPAGRAKPSLARQAPAEGFSLSGAIALKPSPPVTLSTATHAPNQTSRHTPTHAARNPC